VWRHSTQQRDTTLTSPLAVQIPKTRIRLNQHQTLYAEQNKAID
jgi:hypothetical protein